MPSINKIISTASQLSAISIILTFIIGMRWQQGFYGELGYAWIAGYTNYLDTIRIGAGISERLFTAILVGFFSLSILERHKPNYSYCVFLGCSSLILFSEMIAIFFSSSEAEFLLIRSYLQILAAGFLAGGIISYGPEISIKINSLSNNKNKFILLLSLFSAMMLAISDSPITLGVSTARDALDTDFLNFPFATDREGNHWNVIGYSQGNLILAKSEPDNNQLLVKLSNDLSNWTIHPTKPVIPTSISK